MSSKCWGQETVCNKRNTAIFGKSCLVETGSEGVRYQLQMVLIWLYWSRSTNKDYTRIFFSLDLKPYQQTQTLQRLDFFCKIFSLQAFMLPCSHCCSAAVLPALYSAREKNLLTFMRAFCCARVICCKPLLAQRSSDRNIARKVWKLYSGFYIYYSVPPRCPHTATTLKLGVQHSVSGSSSVTFSSCRAEDSSLMKENRTMWKCGWWCNLLRTEHKMHRFNIKGRKKLQKVEKNSVDRSLWRRKLKKSRLCRWQSAARLFVNKFMLQWSH